MAGTSSPDLRPSPGSTEGEGRREILKPFSSLLSAQVIGTALGTGFWLVVARLMATTDVGIAAAAISAQTLVGFFAAMGVGTLLIVELPRHDAARQRVLLSRGLASVALVGLGLGSGVALLAGRYGLLGENLQRGLGHPAGATVFVLGVVAAAAAVVTDESMLGLKRSQVQVWRNLLASGVRFPMAASLLALGWREPVVLQWCWVAPLLGSVLVVLLAIPLPWRGARPVSFRADVVNYFGGALRNHGLTVAVAAGSQLIPVVAAVSLVPADNAAFAIAWLGATFVFLPPYLLAVALFAHGANTSEEEFRESMRWTIPAAMTLSLGLCLLAWGAGRPALRLFGEHYADRSWLLLCLLAPAGLWMVIKDHLVALWRSQRRYTLATKLAGVALLIELFGAALGASYGGAEGLCIGWLVAMLFEALLAVPWMREAFSGMTLRLPTRLPEQSSRPRSVTAGHVVVVVAALFSVAALVVVLLRPESLVSPAHRVDSAAPSSSAQSPWSTTQCRPSRKRPGPGLDLGVQGAKNFTQSLSRAKVDRLVALAAKAGASVISTAVSWSAAQPTADAPVDLRPARRVVEAARAHHLDVRVQVLGAPTWAVAEGKGPWRPPTTAAELARWQDFVHSVLAQLGPVRYLEVWTEPDNPEYWPAPQAASFVRLLRSTSQVVRAEAPHTRIVTGGLDGNDTDYLAQMLDALAKSDAVPFDMLGVHPFSGGQAPGFVPVDAAPESAFLGYRNLHEMLADAGMGTIGLYVGAFGYPATMNGADQATDVVTDAQRASYARQALALATCTPYLKIFSWYYLYATPWDPPAWALVDNRFHTTRTYAALQAWSARRGAQL